MNIRGDSPRIIPLPSPLLEPFPNPSHASLINLLHLESTWDLTLNLLTNSPSLLRSPFRLSISTNTLSKSLRQSSTSFAADDPNALLRHRTRPDPVAAYAGILFVRPSDQRAFAEQLLSA